MKTIELKIYSFDELSHEAKEKAIQQYRENNIEFFWLDEIFESLQSLFSSCYNINVFDYHLDVSNSRLKVKFSYDEIANFTGKRALAWIENNLLCNIRYKHGIRYIKKRIWKSDCVKNPQKLDGAFINLAGKIKECPFTGYCTDDDFLSRLLDDIKSGSTLKEAFEALASEYQKILNAEIDFQNSDEYISDYLIQNDYEFLESGEIY